jgi:beta-glucosidase-like glycosyl hydrolase
VANFFSVEYSWLFFGGGVRWLLVLLIPMAVFGGTAEEFLAGMSLEEKVGQLFVAPVCPLHSADHIEELKALIGNAHLGGIIVKQSDGDGPGRVLNELQRVSRVPLLMMADAEWGLSMTMKGAPVFPKNMTLGAVGDLGLIEELGEEIGRQVRAVGIQMSLAPVVDVNCNPKNPIIHMRSFGDRPDEVGTRAVAMMRGMQKSGLLTCIKHFPGHGDTGIDSHFSLPTIESGMERLKEIELVPFLAGIRAGTDAVMSAHILFPELDTVPATLSFPITTSLLRGELGFHGLIITDALNMKALTDHFSVEEIVVGAHAAGADLLLYGNHVFSDVDSLIQDRIPRAYAALLDAYKKGIFSVNRLDASVLRILRAKERFTDWIVDEKPKLHTEHAADLQRKLYQAAVTQLGPEFAPIDFETAYLLIGKSDNDLLQPAFCPCISLGWEDRMDVFERSRVVVSLRNIEPRLKNYGLTTEQLAFFQELSSKMEVIYCVFGTPYAASLLPKQSTILIGYEDGAQSAVLDVLTGEKQAGGTLPVTF